ncbi:MAG: heavy metal translocating P-type ATPase metal-binding domain-containing protein [Bacteroidota bacterium]|jgi:Cu+-exporting ATPase
MIETLNKNTKTTCYHCGDFCAEETLVLNDKSFCCNGCKNVFMLLSENNLTSYYSIEKTPGKALKQSIGNKYAYLDDTNIQSKLISYIDHKVARLQFQIPNIHCSSCIYLLENLYKINNAVVGVRVNFLKKTANIVYDVNKISLRQLVELLASIGYEPSFTMNDINQEKPKNINRKLLFQIGVAGFCFGNIMMISFPEYFGLDNTTRHYLSSAFGYINLALSIPVFFYSGQDYLISAYKGLRKKLITIDVPLALGLVVLFVRNFYEILSHTGLGYCDTLAGLVFFLLIGKWFQQKTYDSLSFERDYKSYFPISVIKINADNQTTTVAIDKLKIGDRILIRNNEIIPADSILLKGKANIDFSFVSGEKEPIAKELGEIIFAGGKQTSGNIELEVKKLTEQSYLTQLWNNDIFAKDNASKVETFQTKVSKYFTIALLAIAISSAIYWAVYDSSKIIGAFTAVLIIACPCALALSSPFALGNAMRNLGRKKFYLKSANVVEKIANMDTIVFDKTGTITQSNESQIEFIGNPLSQLQKELIFSVTQNSIHPLSKQIAQHLNISSAIILNSFNEITGKGIKANVGGNDVEVGSAKFLNILENESNALNTRIYIKINGENVGCFVIKHAYRTGLKQVINQLATQFKLHLLSGDNEQEKTFLQTVFPTSSELLFKQNPADKLMYINTLQGNQQKVIMVGDGLNDAGALKTANVGISLSEDTSSFSPSSDVIMDAANFELLPKYLQYCKNTMKVIYVSFCLSLLYNIIGLSYAVSGTLSPVIAAILMPISSVTVIGFTSISTYLLARKMSR